MKIKKLKANFKATNSCLLLGFILFAIHVDAQKSDAVSNAKEISRMEKEKFIQLKNSKALTSASDNFSVIWLGIHLKVKPAVRYVNAYVSSTFIMLKTGNEIVWDLTNELLVDSVVYQQQKIDFMQNDNSTLVVTLPEMLEKNAIESMIIYYHGEPGKAATADTGESYSFITKKHKGIPVMFTVNQPFGAFTWFPCRNGLDDKIDSIDFYITHPQEYTATANGKLQSSIQEGENINTHYKHLYPMATYLAAFAVTNYSVFSKTALIDDVSLPVVTHVYPEHYDAFEQNVDTLIYSLKLFSNIFGNYPYLNEVYGQTQAIGAGGMEHQTNSFIDFPDINLQNHELAHQWFGDKVTCANWSDIWLHEGAAEYIADLLSPYRAGDFENYKQQVKSMKNYITSKPGGSVYVKDTTNVSRIFDTRLTYLKAAFLNRMMQYTLGDSLFFTGWKNFVNDTSLVYNFARTSDYQHHMEAVSGLDLNYFFEQWFYGQGYPSIKIKWGQNTSTNKIICQLSQKTSHISVPFYTMPLPVLLKGEGQEKTVILSVDKKQKYFQIEDPGFVVEEIQIDPERWFLTKKNKATKVSFSIFGNDVEFNALNTFENSSSKKIYVERNYHNILNAVEFKTDIKIESENDASNSSEISAKENTSSLKSNSKTFKIVPNPASTEIFISLPIENIKTLIEIFDQSGRKISENTTFKSEKFNIEYLPKGSFIIHVSQDNNSYSDNFVKE